MGLDYKFSALHTTYQKHFSYAARRDSKFLKNDVNLEMIFQEIKFSESSCYYVIYFLKL